MDSQTLIIALLAFLAIGGVGFAFAGGNGSEGASKRAKQLAATGRVDGKTNDPAAMRRRQTQDMLRNLREGEQKKKKISGPSGYWLSSKTGGS